MSINCQNWFQLLFNKYGRSRESRIYPWTGQHTCTCFTCFMTGLGHFKDESVFKAVEGALKDVNVKEVATSGDSCLALSGF